MVAVEEIPRYQLLLSKALSFVHLEKDFTQVIFIPWAQSKLVHFSFFCSGISEFLRVLSAEISGTT